jgi:hypothetical protein
VGDLATKIAEQFALDVYSELKNDIIQAQARASRTSQGNRDPMGHTFATQRIPVITPHNTRRNGHTGTPFRERSLTAA